ncbi:MAG: membrane protein insertion efficiency factor YidD [Elusimicrobiota bacterium]
MFTLKNKNQKNIFLLSIFTFIIFEIIFAENNIETTSILQDSSIKLIDYYQKYISTIKGQTCRFNPTCSNFAKESILKFGFFTGFLMASDRLQRCNYFGEWGNDPVEKHYIFANLTNEKKDDFNLVENQKLKTISVEPNLDLADKLFSDECYDSALLEYTRYVHYNQNSKFLNYSYYKIGLCYLKKSDFKKSKIYFEQCTIDSYEIYLVSQLALGKIYLDTKAYHLARNKYFEICNDEKYPKIAKKAKLLYAWSYVMERRWKEANDEFIQLREKFTEPAEKQVIERIINELNVVNKLKKKSPTKAALFSLIPGFGKIYSAKIADGVFSFFLITGLGYLAYDCYTKNVYPSAVIWSLFTFSFYTGNIYSGADAAINYNSNKEKEFMNNLKREIEPLIEWNRNSCGSYHKKRRT